MKKQIVLEISKTGTDFNTKIPAGALGKDVEIGLAVALADITKHQQTIDPNFKVETLIEKVKGWIKCLQ